MYTKYSGGQGRYQWHRAHAGQGQFLLYIQRKIVKLSTDHVLVHKVGKFKEANFHKTSVDKEVI